MAQNEHKIILSEIAEEMLLTHTEFIARISTTAARKLLSEFKKIKGRLSRNPHQFPFADEIDAPGISPKTYRKCLFYNRYKALFLIEDDNVYIDAIIDCRQENAELFCDSMIDL